ncbi:MAG: Uma2 family endonuclease [Acidobacteria bacterium]|nr:Uma2 family endonuclease [Acidobacteriota bacterium]
METTMRWTSADLELLPDNGKRYEIIDGELYVSKPHRYEHQRACARVCGAIENWSCQTQLGEPFPAPGVIFADDDDVIPDVVWVSRARRDQILGPDGHFHAAPELVVEVLSLTGSNEQRDRKLKLKLYSRRGVKEYWIVNWLMRQVEIYRRRGRSLKLVTTLHASDTITSPLLPGFSCEVREIFEDYLADNGGLAVKNGERKENGRRKA